MAEDEFEDLDSTSETEETVQPEGDTDGETIETEPEVDAAQLQATNKKLFERAKKAEAELKALKGTKKPVEASASPTNVEETVLLANGMDEDLLGELKAVAAVRKTSLIKAQTDPIFVAVKEKFEKDKKHQAASMPASRGSGIVKPKKDFKTPGLSRDEHKAMIESLN